MARVLMLLAGEDVGEVIVPRVRYDGTERAREQIEQIATQIAIADKLVAPEQVAGLTFRIVRREDGTELPG